eukprot:541008-Pleurochrysis_carterae.AAC.1
MNGETEGRKHVRPAPQSICEAQHRRRLRRKLASRHDQTMQLRALCALKCTARETAPLRAQLIPSPSLDLPPPCALSRSPPPNSPPHTRPSSHERH